MKYLCAIAVASLAIACNSEPEPQPKPAPIIIEARYMIYAELPDSVRSRAHDAHTLVSIGETAEEIGKEKGYYLKLTVNNQLLAKASTDGGTNTNLLDPTNFRMLYGKYRNQPNLYTASGAKIKPTVKHEAYDLIYIARNKDIDTSYWGPVSDKPARLELSCSDLDSAHTPRVNVTQ